MKKILNGTGIIVDKIKKLLKKKNNEVSLFYEL
jgi:hypothetical protein